MNLEKLRVRRLAAPAAIVIVLVGDGNYDYKDYLGSGDANWIPPLMTRTSYLWTASDPGYASVYGDDELPDVAMGRLPAKTFEDVQSSAQRINRGARLHQMVRNVGSFCFSSDSVSRLDRVGDSEMQALPARHRLLREQGVADELVWAGRRGYGAARFPMF